MLLTKASLLALNLLQTHCICTYIPWPCDQTGKDCIQPKNRSGKEAGEKLCESAAASKKAAINTSLFLGDAVLKEELLRDARLEGPRWVCGGSSFILAKCSSLLQISLQKDFVHHAGPLLYWQPLPGSRSKSTIKMPPSQLLPRA